MTRALSTVSHIFRFSTARRRAWGVFSFHCRAPSFAARRILINRFVSFRFAASEIATTRWKGFRLDHLSVAKGGGEESRAPLSSTRYIIRESTFANLLPPREEASRSMEAAPKLRALCLWFHNFRRRDVRRPKSIRTETGRGDQNLMRSIEDEFRRRPHLYKRGWIGRWMNIEDVRRRVGWRWTNLERWKNILHACKLSRRSLTSTLTI